MKAVRDVEFSKDGRSLVSCSKDKSILITDLETEKLTNVWDKAHRCVFTLELFNML